MRPRALVCCLLLAAGIIAGAPARAQVGQDVQSGCTQAGGDARACRGVYHLAVLAGVLCRQAGGGDSCSQIDGRGLDPKLVTAAERSWVARALADQRRLDDTQPMQEELWTHTHNSFNAEAYRLTLYGLDPNQLYSITDQLRMGIRAVEIDIHWAHEPDGDPAQGGHRVAVCHGTEIPVGPVDIHAGCGTADPTLPAGLVEVKAWLDAHPNEIVLVYLQNQLEHNPIAHDQATDAIKQTLGPLVYRPPAGRACAPLPVDTSRAHIRATGKRVIVVGDCGPGAWGSWVFQQSPRWIETGMSYGAPYPAYPCAKERAAKNYDRNWIRYWGDETGLSNGTGGGGYLTPDDARNMVRCGVNLIGLDDVRPFDARLIQQVWSWAPSEPSHAGDCAFQAGDGFFRAGACTAHRKFACKTGAGWAVTGPSGSWANGAKRCAAAHATFSVPPSGWQNELLKSAKHGGEVWIDYAARRGSWTPRAI